MCSPSILFSAFLQESLLPTSSGPQNSYDIHPSQTFSPFSDQSLMVTMDNIFPIRKNDYCNSNEGPVKIYWVPRPDFGKNLSSLPILSQKKSSPPIFFLKKKSSPPFFQYKKSLRPLFHFSPKQSHAKS